MHVQQSCIGIDLSNLTSFPVFTLQRVLLLIGADSSHQQLLSQAMQLKIPAPTVLWEHSTALDAKSFPRISPSRCINLVSHGWARESPRDAVTAETLQSRYSFCVLTIHFRTALGFSPHSIQDLSIFNDSHLDEERRKKQHLLILQRDHRDTKGVFLTRGMRDEQN